MLLATFWLAFVVAIPGALPWVLTGVLGLLLVLALASYGSARLAVDERRVPGRPGPHRAGRTSGPPRRSTPRRPAWRWGPAPTPARSW